MSDYNPEHAAKPKAQPVRNIQALVAAMSAVVAALGTVSLVSGQAWVGWVTAVWGLLMVGYNVYQANALPQKVVPLHDTAAYVDENGVQVAGPASPLDNGVPVTTAPAAEEAVSSTTSDTPTYPLD